MKNREATEQHHYSAREVLHIAEYKSLCDAMESMLELGDDQLINHASHALEEFQENYPEIVAEYHFSRKSE